MPVWIAATFAAALVQTVRFSLQKHLRGAGLSPVGATFARFLFAAPLAAAIAALALAQERIGLPSMGARFWTLAIIGGTNQNFATLATLTLFGERAFAVGIAFTKTETVLVAIFSALILGEAVSPAGFAAIVVGLAGVLVLSVPRDGAAWRLFTRASALGLTAGSFFGPAAMRFRAATRPLRTGGTPPRSPATLTAVTAFQTAAMSAWLGWRDRAELARVLARWRKVALVGLTGMAGSLMWFVAFTLENAAYVRALGQVELVFSIAASWVLFREKVRARELAGIALISLSIVVLVLAAS